MLDIGMIAGMTFRLMIVAGEPSGDAHAASLIESISGAGSNSEIQWFGAAGPKMRAAGVESIVNTDELAIVGMVEVGRVLPRFWKVFQLLKQTAVQKKPDAVILVDWPEFNMKLARVLHKRGIRVIYYISPQLWAWRSYRLRGIRRDVDLLLSILPFEPEWYASHGVKHVRFIGNPLAGEVFPRYGRDVFCVKNGLDAAKPIVALLPGSRHKELQRILPPMIEAASRITADRPDVQFVIPLAPSRSIAEAKAIIERKRRAGLRLPDVLRLTEHETREALASVDAAAVASGTATLEAALIGVPLVIVYKESPINWHVLGRLINTEHFGLINLIAGERLVTELIQSDFTPTTLANELLWLLDREHSVELQARLGLAVEKLGGPGASDRAAEAILDALNVWTSKNLAEVK
jgi:lipid-A-disaccharide synthase